MMADFAEMDLTTNNRNQPVYNVRKEIVEKCYDR